MSGEDLLNASKNGDLERVKTLLHQGVNIHYKNIVSMKNNIIFDKYIF